MADWYYDDLRQVGVDFEDTAAVAAYDRNQGTDAAAERTLLDELRVGSGHVVIDIGCGTGVFALEAARRCRAVYAVDVSAGMLAFARRRAEGQGLHNLHFRHGGFLSYGHDGPRADLLVTKYAFHHLPDFWKGVALVRMKEMLGQDGRLFLRDVVFSFPPADCRREIEA